jgi:predicted DNA-binding protein YlxM (UPF0122 family)
MNTENIVEQILPNFTTVSNTLGQIEIIDRELRKIAERIPEHKQEINDAFIACQTMIPATQTRLIKLHVNEQAQRVVSKFYENLAEPTDAEVLSVISEVSIRQPVSRPWAIAYRKLFCKHFPDEHIDKIPTSRHDEDRVKEIYTDIKDELTKQFGDMLNNRKNKYIEKYTKDVKHE